MVEKFTELTCIAYSVLWRVYIECAVLINVCMTRVPWKCYEICQMDDIRDHLNCPKLGLYISESRLYIEAYFLGVCS